MKSLEIEAIEYIISWIENVGVTYDMEVSCYEKSFKKIKKDLEVLEILKKYLYIVENQIPRTDDYFEILESDLDEMQDDENCDDFHRVKQWLEENENDN